jgi:hypothetical protein
MILGVCWCSWAQGSRRFAMILCPTLVHVAGCRFPSVIFSKNWLWVIDFLVGIPLSQGLKPDSKNEFCQVSRFSQTEFIAGYLIVADILVSFGPIVHYSSLSQCLLSFFMPKRMPDFIPS